MKYVSWPEVVSHFRGKSVAVVGSAPSVLDNEPGFVDSHDVVVRVNNHRCGANQGYRTDVHYAFYGNSVKKTPEELKREGVYLCVNKCPNGKPIKSAWHEAHRKTHGIDFRYIYKMRKDWWFCDTYVPTSEQFRSKVKLLDGHIPTTGFAAILDVVSCGPETVYLTGFDFFRSRIHNVNEPWRPGDPNDPIGHVPELELGWLSRNGGKLVSFDKKLKEMVMEHRARLTEIA